MVHGVDPVTGQKGWGNVMYIPAAPWCPRNEAYSTSVREAFETAGIRCRRTVANIEWSVSSGPAHCATVNRRQLDLAHEAVVDLLDAVAEGVVDETRTAAHLRPGMARLYEAKG